MEALLQLQNHVRFLKTYTCLGPLSFDQSLTMKENGEFKRSVHNLAMCPNKLYQKHLMSIKVCKCLTNLFLGVDLFFLNSISSFFRFLFSSKRLSRFLEIFVES